MITRILFDTEKEAYDSVISHPVQSWAWGDFEKAQGHEVVRFGQFENDKMVGGYTVVFYHLPKLSYTVGKCLRGPTINQDMILNVKKVAHEKKAIFVKFEPDVPEFYFKNGTDKYSCHAEIDTSQVVVSPKSMFLPFSFVLDISKTEEELLQSMHPKTRYNIKVANRHGVEIKEESNLSGLKTYLKLQQITTSRQGFYLHTPQYFQALWDTIGHTKIMKILNAYYQGKPISSVIAMVIKNRLFYVYAASSNESREVMAPTLAMWETIHLGKSLGCTSFDMWGSLGPDAKEYDPQFGFHRFKQGFGGILTQFVGSYDLVVYPNFYKIFNQLDKLRWKLLRLKAKFRSN